MADFTIFSPSLTPSNNDSDGSVAQSLGERFTVTSTGYQAKALRYFVPSQGISVFTTALVQLWNETTATKLAEVNLLLETPPSANAWMEAVITRISLNTTDSYVVCSYTLGAPGRLVYQTSTAFPITSGPLHSTTGLFRAGGTSAQLPNSTTGIYFLADLVLSPALSAGTFSAALGGLTAAITGKRKVAGTFTAALGGLTGAVTGKRKVHAIITMTFTLTAGVTGRKTVHGILRAPFGALAAAIVVTAASQVQGNGWYGLLSILAEGRQLHANPPLRTACTCGEPLESGPHGELHCRFDGRIFPAGTRDGAWGGA